MQESFITPEALATRWNLATKTLSQWRWNGHGPKYYKFGKLVRYQIEEVMAFEQSRQHHSTLTLKCLTSRSPTFLIPQRKKPRALPYRRIKP
jgi:hypothetical protein